MKKIASLVLVLILTVCFSLMFATSVFAEEANPQTGAAEISQTAQSEKNAESEVTKTKIIIVGALIAVVASAGAIAMALSICKASDGMARQPEAAGNIRSNAMLGLVFIETAIIYALIIAIFIVFVL